MTFQACLTEIVETLRNALPDGTDIEEWVGDMDFHEIDGAVSDTETIAHCCGYLRGAAECADVTVLELLWAHRINLQPRPRRRRRQRAA